MDKLVDQLIEHYGLTVLLSVLVLIFFAWAIIHVLAAPGKQISLLYGLVSYTKRDEVYKPPKRQKPIEVIHELSGTLWRIMTPIEEWIELDLTAVGYTYRSSLLSGPYHAACKRNLSYFDNSSMSKIYRIRRKCRQCNIEVIPKNVTDDRSEFKKMVVELIQEVHLRGEKIESGMVVGLLAPSE